MSLACEYLPATDAARQELVLLHGWGCNRDIWRPLLSRVRGWANVTLVDIPGCAPQAIADQAVTESESDTGEGGAGDKRNTAGPGPGAAPALDQVLEQLLAACPQRAVFIGWSLGGQLASEIALRHPQRMIALVTLCSNPCFVERDGWPGMAGAAFRDFAARVAADPRSGLKRFHALQVQGSAQEASLRRRCRQLAGASAGPSLLAGLGWLATLDQRAALANLAVPQLHLFAECDALVPAVCEHALAAGLGATGDAATQVLPGLSHLAPLEAPDSVAREITMFLEGAQLLANDAPEAPRIEKRAVADSFSRAAVTYDDMAHLQHAVGQRLLERLDALTPAPSTVLDLGCGTGFFRAELKRRFPQADYVGLDIAAGMVDYARARGDADDRWLVGDAEALPLASGSVDLVFSSLAVQWCYRPALLFAELYRVLRPGGVCVFTSLGPDTLQELRAAWAAVDGHQHVNEFLPVQELQQCAATVRGLALAVDNEAFCMRYARVRDLLAELKAIGAHNMNRGRPGGLTGRRALAGMVRAYEDWREDGLLPATYDVIFGSLEKP